LSTAAACADSWDEGIAEDGIHTYVKAPYAVQHHVFPAHFRAECGGNRILMGIQAVGGSPPPEERTWPAGPDVVLTRFSTFGVHETTALEVAERMLQPVGLCYARLAAEHSDAPPQGRIFVSGRLAFDGVVLDDEVVPSDALPAALVACTRKSFRSETFGVSGDDLSTVEMVLHFVFRRHT
jgi:hypothetical protein